MIVENLNNDQLGDQLLKIQQEYSVPFSSRIKLDMLNPHEQLKQLVNLINQRERTCCSIVGIALYLMDKQRDIVDLFANAQLNLNQKENQLNEQSKELLNQQKEYENMVKSLDQKLELKNNTIQEIQNKQEREEKKIVFLQQENENLKQELTLLQEETRNQIEKIQASQQKIEKQKNKIQSLKKINQNMNQLKNQKQGNQLSSHQEEMYLLQQKLLDITEEYEKLSLKNDELYNQSQVEQNKNQDLHLQIQENDKEIQQLRGQVQQVLLENQILQEKNESLKQDLIDSQDLYKQIIQEKEIVLDPAFSTPEPRMTFQRSSLSLVLSNKNLQTELCELNQMQEQKDQIPNFTFEKRAQKLIEQSKGNIYEAEVYRLEANEEQSAIQGQILNSQSDIVNRLDTEEMFVGDTNYKLSAQISISKEQQSKDLKNRLMLENQLMIAKQDPINYMPEQQPQQKQINQGVDLVEQHFILLTQSIKINSPHIDEICTVSNSQL